MLRYAAAAGEGSALAVYLASQRETLLKIYEGRPYVLCTYYIPSALTALIDAEVLYIDRIVGLCAGARLIPRNSDGLPSDRTCSYQQAFFSLIESGLLPKPSAEAATEYPCTGAVELCKALHRKYGIPLYTVSGNPSAEELRGLGEWLLHRYGQRQGLSETAGFYNRALGLKRDIDRRRLRKPGILPGGLCLKLFCVENDLGRPSALHVMQALNHEAHDRMRGHVCGDNRLFWMGLVPLYDNNLLRRLERKTGCSFVFEEMWMFGGGQISVSTFYEDLARTITENIFYHQARREERILAVIRQSGAGAAVNFLQRRCSFLPRTAAGMRRRLETAGIPVIHAAADVVSGTFDEKPLLRFIDKCGRIRVGETEEEHRNDAAESMRNIFRDSYPSV